MQASRFAVPLPASDEVQYEPRGADDLSLRHQQSRVESGPGRFATLSKESGLTSGGAAQSAPRKGIS